MKSIEPPRYERAPLAETSFMPFERRVCELLAEFPEMPATVLAERVGWEGSSSWFRENVARLRPEQRRPDPADRLEWAPGDAARCDLWFPPKEDPAGERLGGVVAGAGDHRGVLAVHLRRDAADPSDPQICCWGCGR